MENEELINGEQPQEEQPAENSVPKQSAENEQQELLSGSPYGKFKSLETLLKAYTDLEKEFTKKCQKIKELSNVETSTSTESVPQYQQENWHQVVKDFFLTHPDAVEFANDMSNVLSSDKVIASSNNSLEQALTRVKAGKFKPENEIVKDENFLKNYVLNNVEIREKIITDYINGILNTQTAPLISKNGGGTFSIAPKQKPTSILEAGKIAESIFKIQ